MKDFAMSAVDGKQLLATDVYPTWRRQVKAAETSVRLYSPYLNRLAVDLLRNAKLTAHQLSVLTDLSPASGTLDYRGQLLALKRLIDLGVEVRSLPRLHAKVLLVDGQAVTVGSQNFTSYARRSHEATFAPTTNVSDSRFMATLERWWADGQAIDRELIERLLDNLAVLITDANSAIELLVTAYEETEVEYRDERRRAAITRFQRDLARSRASSTSTAMRKAATASRYSAGQTVAYAHLEWLDDGYFTLMRSSREVDLTRWRISSGRVTQTVTLDRLAFYPTLLGPKGRMAFVRVAKSRISYIWRGVRWGGARTIGGRRVYLRASFPDDERDGANLVITFGWNEGAAEGYQLRMRFDGMNVLPVAAGRPTGNSWGGVMLAGLIQEVYEDEWAWNEVIREVFSPAHNPRGFLAVKNAASFFPRGWLRIDHTKVLDESVLLVQPLQ